MTTVPVTPVPSEPILDNGQGVIDPDVYFQINKSPADLPEFESKLSAFIDYHKEKNNKVVFITVSLCNISMYILVFIYILYNRVVELLCLLRTKPFVLLITLVSVRVVQLQLNTFWKLVMLSFLCIVKTVFNHTIAIIHIQALDF